MDIGSIFNVTQYIAVVPPVNWSKITYLTVSGHWDSANYTTMLQRESQGQWKYPLPVSPECIEREMAKMCTAFRGKLDNVVELKWLAVGFPEFHLFPFLSSLHSLYLAHGTIHDWPDSAFLALAPHLRFLNLAVANLPLKVATREFISRLGCLHFPANEGDLMSAKYMINAEGLCFNAERSEFALDLMESSAWLNLKWVNLHGIRKMRNTLQGVIGAMISSPTLKYISMTLRMMHCDRSHKLYSSFKDLCPVFGVCRDALLKRERTKIILRFVFNRMDGFDWIGNEGILLRKEIIETVRVLQDLKIDFAIGWKFRIKNQRKLMKSFLNEVLRQIRILWVLKADKEILKDGQIYEGVVFNRSKARRAYYGFHDGWGKACPGCIL